MAVGFTAVMARDAIFIQNGLNFQDVLAMADMDLDDLVSVTIYCPDLSLYGDFNEVYRSFFEGDFPARAFIGSGPLLFGMRFEMQAIAVR